MKNNPIIVALDVKDIEVALTLVDSLKEYVNIFKIGPVLFLKYGPEIVLRVKEYGCKVFLDLKLHDIPNTVSMAVWNARELGVDMLTLHITGGRTMLEKAVKSAGNELLLLGVTVLTSLNGIDLQISYKTENIKSLVDSYCNIAYKSGVKGIVSSSQEVKSIKEKFSDLIVVTPGIRPEWCGKGDQKRIGTPKQALNNGADYLVIGRPIIQAENPVENTKRILNEIQ